MGPFDSDLEHNAVTYVDGARRSLVMSNITTEQSLSLIEGYHFRHFARILNPPFKPFQFRSRCHGSL